MEFVANTLGTPCVLEELDGQCASLVLSKIINILIIAGSFGLKIPQILKILSAKSVSGLSESAFYLETVTYTMNIVYNIRILAPLATYMEMIVVWFQDLFLVLLLWVFTPSACKKSVFTYILMTIGFGGFCAGLMYVTEDSLPLLPTISTVLIICARMPQIISNVKNGHTGQLSVITCLLTFLGCVARVFTTLQEVDDVYILSSYLISTALNFIVFAQLLWYWKATNEVVASLKDQKQK
eukprot:TRINITY_DN778064_c0_g1_i1.p1 TRINITY_DN778064_c0_g1~~TRINITY_DN778064_c0_g1_i1.p1  ORF type:complete len:239 (+),score=37.47 TRINITY_DN778064_c0_g1_i1:29-745(+)